MEPSFSVKTKYVDMYMRLLSRSEVKVLLLLIRSGPIPLNKEQIMQGTGMKSCAIKAALGGLQYLNFIVIHGGTYSIQPDLSKINGVALAKREERRNIELANQAQLDNRS